MTENKSKTYPCSPDFEKIIMLNNFEKNINTGDFLPTITGVKNEHIIKKTRSVIGELIWVISRIDDDEGFSRINCDQEIIKTKLNQLSEYLELCIEAFLVGEIAKCHESINKLIYEYLTPIRTVMIPEKQSFYRMRPKKNTSGHNLTYKEMFHIPFDMIERVSNQRYSISGYPVLYLGSNLQLCWNEIGNPNLSECFVSYFTNTMPLKLLDMTFPSEVKNENDILWIALILATSIPKTTDDGSFVPEYIISQSILHSLIKRDANEGLNGIVYTSSKYYIKKESFAKYQDSFNYAFPTINKNYRISGYCEDLLEMFQNTKGVPLAINDVFTETEEKLKKLTFPDRYSGIDKLICKDRTLLDRNPFM